MAEWTDAIVGDRMAVDQQFSNRIAGSEFTSQQWGLIMTATSFDIEQPDDPEDARLVSDTEKLPGIMPELDNIQAQMGMAGGGGSRDSGGPGIVGQLKSALGLGDSGSNGPDEATLQAAEQLTQEYATELQSHLEQKGKWEQVRIAYQESGD